MHDARLERESSSGNASDDTPAFSSNCFDLLRLLLAGIVVYNHAYPLGGFGEEDFKRIVRGQSDAGTVGVIGFFGISGYLICASYERVNHVGIFLKHRICRIFPAFYACLIIVAAFFAPAIFFLTRGTLGEFPLWGNEGAIDYVFANIFLLMRQNVIGDVLQGLPDTRAINGPPWTLFLEFMCYLGVLLAGLLGLLRTGRAHLLIVTGVALTFHVSRWVVPDVTYPGLPTFIALIDFSGFPCAFLVGMCCWAYRDCVTLNWRNAIITGMVCAVLLKAGGWNAAAPVIFTLFILNLGYSFRLRLKHDFSYGLYIYHWPCQLLLAAIPFFRQSFVIFLVSSALLTMVFALLSWFVVERPALRWARQSPAPAA